MSLGVELGLGPGDVVLDGDPAPPLQKKRVEPTPNFRPMFIVHGQTAGWIKMVLGMEVGLSPGDLLVVLDGDPAPSQKKDRASSPIWPISIVAKRLD